MTRHALLDCPGGCYIGRDKVHCPACWAGFCDCCSGEQAAECGWLVQGPLAEVLIKHGLSQLTEDSAVCGPASDAGSVAGAASGDTRWRCSLQYKK
jgi:hypothetical protein